MEFKEYIQTDRKTALCLSEMAAIVADGVSLDSYEKCRLAVQRFNHHYGDKLGEAVSLDDVWNAVTDLQLLPHFTIPAQNASYWKADGLLVELLLYGLLEGYTHWCGKSEDTAKTLIERFTKTARQLAIEILGTVCPKERFGEIVCDLAALAQSQSKSASAAELWLFQLLCKYDLHSIGLLEMVCDSLFATTIELSASRQMDSVLSGPNGSCFARYIHDSFVNSYRQGKMRFGFAEGAIRVHEVLRGSESPLSRADQLCVRAETAEEQLPWIAAISMLLWSQILDGPDPEPGYTPSEDFCGVLQNFLLHPAAEYSLAASCVEDLILSGKATPFVLNEDIVRSAIPLLRDAELAKWAEHLLCLFEGHIEVDEEIKREYALRFDGEVSCGHFTADPGVTFGCCYAMEAWSAKEEKARFMELGRFYSQNLPQIDHYHLTRAQRLLHRVFPDNQWFPLTQSADNVNELFPLSEKECSCWDKLLSETNAPLCLTTKKAAIDAILFLDASFRSILEEPQRYRAFLSNLRFQPPNPGSYLITRWFAYLALLDLGEEAVAFYRRYKNILDLPFCFHPLSWHDKLGDILRFVHFFDHGSRLVDGLRNALHLGKTAAICAFLNSEYRQLVDCGSFWERTLPFVDAAILPALADQLGGKYGLREEALRRLPQESRDHSGVELQEPVYTDFYDDKSVILYAFKTKPAIRRYLKHWIRRLDPEMEQELGAGGLPMKIYDPAKDRIIRNRIRCIHCDDMIESRHYHDFVMCACGNCAVDGGLEYLRRLSRERDGFEELAEFAPREDWC